MGRKGGYKYVGLQYGKECYADNTYGTLGKATDADCYKRCGPADMSYCGGDWRNSVYQI